jgi:hypothetical protein
VFLSPGARKYRHWIQSPFDFAFKFVKFIYYEKATIFEKQIFHFFDIFDYL